MMKQTAFFFFLIIFSRTGRGQNLDSFLAAPQTIELAISTPQPRLMETFQITLDVNHLRANIFRSLIGKVELADQGIVSTDYGKLVMNVTALQKGKNQIGPLSFILNQTKYTTNAISYEVIDPLPKVDKGLWFRKVVTSDSTFCIIIEQRIPANAKAEQSGNSIKLSTEPQYTAIAKFKDSYSVKRLSGINAQSETNFGRVNINGEDRQFMYGYSVYYFIITDRQTSIKITKEKLENIPVDYKFDEIIIQ
jgi:hypothetical protein